MQTQVYSDGSIFIDHYAVLGVDLSAPRSHIQRSFRRLAKVLHPDVAGGDGLKFLELYAAYRVLSDDSLRNHYNIQYVEHAQRKQQVPQEAAGGAGRAGPSPGSERALSTEEVVLPPGRLVFPGNVAVLARRGLLRRKFRRLHRRWIWNINYDVELPLLPRELMSTLVVSIPVVARTLCPDCRGSNLHCPACNGRGSYKNTRIVRLRLNGGLVDGQIIEVPLERLRLESLSYFKKKRLRMRIRLEHAQPA